MKMHFRVKESFPLWYSRVYDTTNRRDTYTFACGTNWFSFEDPKKARFSDKGMREDNKRRWVYSTDDPDKITCKTCKKLWKTHVIKALESIDG